MLISNKDILQWRGSPHNSADYRRTPRVATTFLSLREKKKYKREKTNGTEGR